MNTPQYFCHHCSCPHSEPQPSLGDLSPQETLQGQKVGLGQVPMKSLLFPCPVNMRPCLLPSKSVVCLSPVKCLGSRSTGIKAKYSAEGFSSQCQMPRLGSLMWSSELLLLWENLCDTIIIKSHTCWKAKISQKCPSYHLGVACLWIQNMFSHGV